MWIILQIMFYVTFGSIILWQLIELEKMPKADWEKVKDFLFNK